jgi:hypothetical protein
LKERDHMGDLVTDGKIILKQTLKKQDRRAWMAFL